MRKLGIVAAVIGAITLASCKGNYNCVCMDGSTALGTSAFNGVSKADAQIACDSLQGAFVTIGLPNTTCTLSKQ